VAGPSGDADDIEKISPAYSVDQRGAENVPRGSIMLRGPRILPRQNRAHVTDEADCRVKFRAHVPLLHESPPARDPAGALDARVLTVMPSLSRPSRSSPLALRPPVRLLIAVAVLAALVALPRAHAAPTPPAASSASVPAAPSATSAKGKPPTCQAIMQRLSGSLAGTPSTADKPGAVLVDVDKAGVTMACSHSDAVAIPVPGAGKPR
jgi:hypothetical protein